METMTPATDGVNEASIAPQARDNGQSLDTGHGQKDTEGNEPSPTQHSGEVYLQQPQSDQGYELAHQNQTGSAVPHDHHPKPADEDARYFEAMYMKARDDLRSKEQELNAQKERFKGVVKELNKVKVKSQSHMGHHIPDNELEGSVKQLQFRIRNFTIQYFDVDSQAPSPNRPRHQKQQQQEAVSKYLGITWDQFSNLLRSQSQGRLCVIQALIWATLCDQLFGKFTWANNDVSKAMLDIKDFLHPESNKSLRADPEALRRCHLWRANTSVVVLDASKAALASEPASTEAEFCKKTAEYLDIVLRPVFGASQKDLLAETFSIVQEAMELDKVFHKQVALFTWIHKPDQLPEFSFNPEEMEFDATTGSNLTGKPADWLVVTPGLKKRGKSTGQDFDQVSVLFKVEVADRSKAIGPGTKSKESSRWFA